MPTSRTVVITGGSSGIGAAAAAQFAREGAEVIVVGRDVGRTADVAERVGGTALVSDFSELNQVRRLAAQLLERCPRIDVLASNAGGMLRRRTRTADGFELTMQANHLASFLLIELLGRRLQDSAARVLATSSAAHRLGHYSRSHLQTLFTEGASPYLGSLAYSRSKLANILHMRELHRRWGPLGVVAMSFHPGLVASSFGSDGGIAALFTAAPTIRARMLTPAQAAQRMVWLGTAALDRTQSPMGHTPTYDGPVPGEYHDGMAGAAATSRAGRSMARAAQLWDASAAALTLS
jgi:NAD(P)-dependent dehydrogenase (short-subunit alcohol dehydrogenase family)